MAKIAFFEVKEEWEKKLIEKNFPKKDILMYKEPFQDVNPNELQEVDTISVFIYSQCNKEHLEKLPNLKFIAARSTGYDHIDMPFCKQNGIRVCNVPHYGENTVAEFTFGLLITLSRKIIDSANRVKSGSFDFSGLRGFDLAGKKVGLVGFGNIGQKFAKMCKGFEMEVIAYDAFADKLKKDAKKIGVKLVSLDEVIKTSDVISLHVPLLPQTRHILNKKAFDDMKDDVIILNTSRGDLIDSTALMRALISKKVAFAGLDVLEGECMIKDEIELLHEEKKKSCDMQIMLEGHMIINHKNVIVTPHNAFNTIDALMRILNTSIDNINNFKNNKKVKDNRVDL